MNQFYMNLSAISEYQGSSAFNLNKDSVNEKSATSRTFFDRGLLGKIQRLLKTMEIECQV